MGTDAGPPHLLAHGGRRPAGPRRGGGTLSLQCDRVGHGGAVAAGTLEPVRVGLGPRQHGSGRTAQ